LALIYFSKIDELACCTYPKVCEFEKLYVIHTLGGILLKMDCAKNQRK
jgi:hypothetical protein